MRPSSLLITTGLLLALAGCVPTGGHPTRASSPSATPVFASDAEALAAAEKAYATYLKVSGMISADGGSGPGRIDPYVTKEQAPREHKTYAYFSSNQLHTTGIPKFSSPKLEQLTFDREGAADLTFYTCVDASHVRVLDVSNNDVTPANRQDLTPLEVTLVSSATAKSDLLVSESSTWSGPGVCS